MLIKPTLKRILSGLAIGFADLIPGVSGGTMAVILNVYDDIVFQLNELISFKKGFWKAFGILAQFGVGVILGILSLAQIISFLLQAFPSVASYFFVDYFFMGLILGSVVMFQSRYQVSIKELTGILMLMIGLILSLGVSLLSSSSFFTEVSSYYIFFSAVLAAAAILLPGISGSMMLLVLGVYPTIIEGIKSLDLGVLLPLSLGMSLGIISMVKLVNWAILKHPKSLYQLVIGLLIGSLLLIWPGVSEGPMLLLDLLLMFIGIGVLKYFG